MKKTQKLLVNLFILSIGILSLTGCAYVPETIEMAYDPIPSFEAIDKADEVNLEIHVLDNRKNGKYVGCKSSENLLELGAISLAGEFSEDISNAIKQEMGNRGFNTSGGNVTIDVEINKFNNDFKQGLIKARSVAELVLGVNVQNDQGLIFYSKTIIGIGENNDIWIQSGNNAKVALQDALQDAICKLINDRAFIQAVFKANQNSRICKL